MPASTAIPISVLRRLRRLSFELSSLNITVRLPSGQYRKPSVSYLVREALAEGLSEFEPWAYMDPKDLGPLGNPVPYPLELYREAARILSVRNCPQGWTIARLIREALDLGLTRLEEAAARIPEPRKSS